jgi:hypothetical protein
MERIRKGDDVIVTAGRTRENGEVSFAVRTPSMSWWRA